jgi:hypothetical protein
LTAGSLLTGRTVSELARPPEQTLNGNGITVALETLGAKTRIPAAVTGRHRDFGIKPVPVSPIAALTVRRRPVLFTGRAQVGEHRENPPVIIVSCREIELLEDV